MNKRAKIIEDILRLKPQLNNPSDLLEIACMQYHELVNKLSKIAFALKYPIK